MWVGLKLKPTPKVVHTKQTLHFLQISLCTALIIRAVHKEITEWANIVTFCPKHPNRDQNLPFTSQSEMLSIPITFFISGGGGGRPTPPPPCPRVHKL